MKKCISIALVAAICLSSCSVFKKISRKANEFVLKNEAFSHAHTGIAIYEPSTNKYWYHHQAEKYFVPASNAKLATCYVAMKFLGDSLEAAKYRVINDTTIVLEGTGDPSFLHSDFNNQGLFALLKNFQRVQLVHSAFEDFLGNGWSWSDYTEDYMAQRSAFPVYGNVVKIKHLNSQTISFTPSYFKTHSKITEDLSDGFTLQKSWDDNEFTFSNGREKSAIVPFRPGKKTLKDLLQDTLHVPVEIINNYTGSLNQVMHSQPTDSLLKIMIHRSDNFFAEQSLLMVSNKLLGTMNDRKIIDTILQTDFKLLPQKPSWADGSGLSRYNLFSPKDFIVILNKMKEDFGMDRLKTILPTGGTGTFSNYYLADSNYIFAKTGSLTGVTTLSGFLYTKKNKLLLFSIMINNHRSSPTDIRKSIEKFIQNIRMNN